MTQTPSGAATGGHGGAAYRQPECDATGGILSDRAGSGVGWKTQTQAERSRAEKTARQIEVARALGAGGYCLFSFTQIFPSPSHESGKDVSSRNLRAALRATLLVLNSGKEEPSRAPPPVSTALDSRRNRSR